MYFTRQNTYLALLSAATVALVSGCSGSQTPKANAQIRAIDAATNGQTTTVIINQSEAFGEQQISSPVSGYLYVQTNTPSTFSYTSGTPKASDLTYTSDLPTGVVAPVTTQTLTTGALYTEYLVGRPDQVVASGAQPASAMQVLVYPDVARSASTGHTTVRVLDAAPNAGNVDVLINGARVATNVPFASLSSIVAANSGSVTVQVNATGTSTVLVPSTPLTFADTAVETIIVTEPTAPTAASATTALTYGVKQIED